jgi:hypothetical protein
VTTTDWLEELILVWFTFLEEGGVVILDNVSQASTISHKHELMLALVHSKATSLLLTESSIIFVGKHSQIH